MRDPVSVDWFEDAKNFGPVVQGKITVQAADAIDLRGGPLDLQCLGTLARLSGRTVTVHSDYLTITRGELPVRADIWTEALPEIARALGQISEQTLMARRAVMFDRAASRIAARADASGLALSGLTRDDVDILAHRHPYSHFFALDELELTHKRFDGQRSQPMERAVFLACDAVLVLPYDPVRDHVLLVEQFRAGPWGRHDPKPWQIEPIAGRIDAGETPEAAARREAHEEAGLQLDTLELIGRSYPSPGTSTEFYHMFASFCDLPPSLVGQHGLAEENEDIQTHLMAFETLDAYAQEGRISNLPLLTAIHWLARRRSLLSA
ncbi:NUDIX domain-containing protein [Algirhabdus cladophorae]|uniref:NUDIX domain-containing protein n=1 Tax=Algirhabdus cladophorae TaxID=3377108 RepID=UPI003B84B3D9